MGLRQFFYLSRVTNTPTKFELNRILQISQRNNRRSDITGCLLYSGRHYAQVLEGDGAALDGLIACIAQDPRHHDFTVAADREIDAREFADWSMGFLYKLDVVDRIDELLAAQPMPEDRVLALKADMRTDSVMGAL